MKNINTQDLENKYWAAELSDEEREILHTPEVRDNLSEELRMILDYFDSEKEEISTRPILVPQSAENLKSETKVIQLNRANQWQKIAAAIAVLVLAGTLSTTYLVNKNKASVATEDTFENPDEALEEVIKSLSFASEKISQGYSATQMGLEETEIFNLFNL